MGRGGACFLFRERDLGICFRLQPWAYQVLGERDLWATGIFIIAIDYIPVLPSSFKSLKEMRSKVLVWIDSKGIFV